MPKPCYPHRLSAILGFCFLLIVVVFPPAAAAQKFVATGPMQVPRYGHTATLLSNGNVLLAGGSDGKSLLTSAEIYDAHTGKFRLTGSMSTARRDAAAALLPDGDVLIAGGHDASGKPLSSAEVYDAKSGTFRATGDLDAPLDGIAAFRLADGDVAVLGKSGCSTSEPVCTDAVEIYEPALGLFMAANDLPQGSGSWGYGAAQLKDGDLLVIGGYLPVGTAAVLAAEIDDPLHHFAHFTRGDPIVDELKPATVTLPDGTVLLAGGVHHSGPASISELYHPDSDSFTLNGNSKTERLEHLMLLPNHDVLATGGGPGFDSAELYHPATHVFQQIGSMNTGHSGDTATLLKDGRVLIAGGVHYVGNPPITLELSQPSAELFLPLLFRLDTGVRKKWVDEDDDWVAFTVYARGDGPAGTKVELSCTAARFDCDVYPDEVALGGKSYVIVSGLSGFNGDDIAVWVKGQANGESQTVKLMIEKNP